MVPFCVTMLFELGERFRKVSPTRISGIATLLTDRTQRSAKAFQRTFSELVQSMSAEQQQRIAKRVRESLASMPLDEIRKARQMTQAKLAETPGVNQGEISKIEHRTDIYISTLAGYVKALGGKLAIRAIFPDGEVRISQFEELQ
jgi:hypothetical protein